MIAVPARANARSRPLSKAELRNLFLTGLGVATLSLAVALGFAARQMFRFRNRLHGILVNQRWEQTLREQGAYRDSVIVFFGDSQLALWRLAPSFGAMPIKNRGISGDRAVRAIRRFQRDVIGEQATLVVLLIGTNDLADGYEVEQVVESIEKLVEMAAEAGIEVVLCSLLPVRGVHAANRPPEKIRQINAQLARHDDITLLDFHAPLLDSAGLLGEKYTDDDLHPNERGYALMTRMLLPRLARHLALSKGDLPGPVMD